MSERQTLQTKYNKIDFNKNLDGQGGETGDDTVLDAGTANGCTEIIGHFDHAHVCLGLIRFHFLIKIKYQLK